jgi:hypothetical protein
LGAGRLAREAEEERGWGMRRVSIGAAILLLVLLLGLSPTPALAGHCPSGQVDRRAFASDAYYCERHGFVGPIGWWWNTVWYDFTDKSVAGMAFWGIEVFFAGIFFTGWAVVMLCVVVVTGVRSLTTS